ncbi:hypothetical protein [Streptomyces sp. NPDC091259]|uniref:hypothetical protein n=1 Tax=Streptomyces sp. NPDC091259 TaxID=3365976 RepID=UPI00380857DD
MGCTEGADAHTAREAVLALVAHLGVVARAEAVRADTAVEGGARQAADLIGAERPDRCRWGVLSFGA